MLTAQQLEKMQLPITRALFLQDRISRLKDDLAADEIEYNQIILHCREHGYLHEGNYTISTTISSRRAIDPVLFANQFPAANQILIQRQAAFLGSELDRLVSLKYLPSIKIEDAKELVGNTMLDAACKFIPSEKVSIVKEKEE